MGYNTACIILNDQLHNLAETKDVGQSIRLSVLSASRRPEAGDRVHRTAGFCALASEHADTIQIVAVGGNCIRPLGYGRYTDEPEALLRNLADQMGFSLRRKPERAA